LNEALSAQSHRRRLRIGLILEAEAGRLAGADVEAS
jgi:hypothetical protein